MKRNVLRKKSAAREAQVDPQLAGLHALLVHLIKPRQAVHIQLVILQSHSSEASLTHCIWQAVAHAHIEKSVVRRLETDRQQHVLCSNTCQVATSGCTASHAPACNNPQRLGECTAQGAPPSTGGRSTRR